MNDKIGKIAAAALDAAVPETYTFMDHDKLTRFADEFACRIIRECININKQELSFAAFEKLMNKYHDHFGVKE